MRKRFSFLLHLPAQIFLYVDDVFDIYHVPSCFVLDFLRNATVTLIFNAPVQPGFARREG